MQDQRSHDKPSIRLAFIGTGNWARVRHLPALQYIREHQPDGRRLILHGIHGLHADEAAQLATQYEFIRTYASLGEILDDPYVDTVAVVVTPAAACEVIKQIAVKGVSLFTEKPPGVSHAEARELADVVHQAHVVGFNRRYSRLNNRFKQLLTTLGPIQSVRGEMHRRNRRESEFITLTGTHLINLMEYLFGTIRTADPLTQRHPLTGEPMHTASVTFESGCSGQIVLAPCSDRHWEGVTVTTADRTMVLHSPNNDKPGRIVMHTRTDGSDEGQELDREDEMPAILAEGYVAEYLDLFSAICEGRPTRSNFGNAVNTMRVAEAMQRGVAMDTASVTKA